MAKDPKTNSWYLKDRWGSVRGPLSEGEIEDLRRAMPDKIKALWKEA